MREAETEMLQLQAKEPQRLPAIHQEQGNNKEGLPHSGLRRATGSA